MRTRRRSAWDGRLRRWLASQKSVRGGHPIRGIMYGQVVAASRAVPGRFSYPAAVDVCEHEVTGYLDRLGLESA